MALYVYVCPKCESAMTVHNKTMNPPDKPPVCECGETMKREWSSPNVIYTGNGFYTTDNKEK